MGDAFLRALMVVGVFVVGPLWLYCLFRVLQWLFRAERQLRPGMTLGHTDLWLFLFLGSSAPIVQTSLLTQDGLAARRQFLKWAWLFAAMSVALILLVLLGEAVTH